MGDQISLRKTLALTGLLLSAAIALPAHSQEHEKGQHSAATEAPNPHDFSSGNKPHHLPWRHPEEQKALAARAKLTTQARLNAHTLTYYGGPVISKVNVVQVAYGTGTYQPYVSGTGAGTMSAFYKGVVASPYFTWLNADYKTTTQTIGTGTFGGDFAITPAATRNGTTIDDVAIQAELLAQIAAGKLPAPTANSYYAINFPKGKKITQGGTTSCASGGFCAYHGTIRSSTTPGGYIFYGVLPDNSAGSGCDTGCGTNANPFNNWTSVASHELIEAVTDPAVGVATVYGSPLAWYNKTYGEIGDICNAQQGTVTGTDGVVYTVQKEWSNSTNTCRAQ
jgi:hypothetical protein